MEKTVIRKARLEDLKTVQDLNHALFASDGSRDKYLNHNWPYEDGKAYFEKRIGGKDFICLAAEVKSGIVGYLAGKLLKAEPWRLVKKTELENMFVQEKI